MSVHAAELFPRIIAPDEKVREEATARQNALTKPMGALGRLEQVGIWLAACQGQCPPHRIEDARVYVFAGDHGVAKNGISAYPPEVSLQMVDAINSGAAGVSVLAASVGAKVQVIDISLDHDAEGPYRIRRSSGAVDKEDAMTTDETIAAIRAGIAIADSAVDSGADLLIAGDLGIGNTTIAAALIGTICNEEPVVVVGRGTGVDDEGWKRKVSAIRDAMFRARDLRHDPIAVLRTIASPDLAAMAGFLAQAAVRRTPVILDGVVVTAVALMANKLAPGARQWWTAGHKGAEPAHALALKYLRLDPLLEAGFRLGEGSGAVAALPMVRMAADILIDMRTFEETGVAEAESYAPGQNQNS